MSKAKATVTFSSIFTKIIIGVAALALVACIVILSVKCAKNKEKDYYECTRYQWHYVSGNTPDYVDLLEQYEYYRLYLNKDNTFTIKYMAKSDSVERSEGGTYVKSGAKYVLTYSSTPTQDLSNVVTYEIEDGNLTRSEQALAATGIYYTVIQVFSKK